MSSSSMVTPILLLRANIDIISCLITVLLNLSFIYKILHRKTRNLFLINSSLNVICSCLTISASNILTFYYSISSQFNPRLCRLNGYLSNSFFHGIIYSYVLLSINLFASKNMQSSKCFIFTAVLLQWCLAFSTSYVFNQYDFQAKGRFCFARKRFSLLWTFLNSFILPISFIFLLNLMAYLYHHLYRQTANSFRHLSRRLYRRQHQKYIQISRQTVKFFCVVFFGWEIFLLLSLLDRSEILPDDLYLIILSFSSISLLIITLLIELWNKPGTKSPWFANKHSRTVSTTTIRFSPSINRNRIDLV